MAPRSFREGPLETFKRHVTISTFHEGNVGELKELTGSDGLLMGSDWPHAEGLPEPTDYIREPSSFGSDETRALMRDNGRALVERRPA